MFSMEPPAEPPRRFLAGLAMSGWVTAATGSPRSPRPPVTPRGGYALLDAGAASRGAGGG
ncbi:hypothetical protein QJS66_02505 [Kocuria rhizophila]|nr:hypothetical protein QJS66_02505 [Kocuria rhizophila]